MPRRVVVDGRTIATFLFLLCLRTAVAFAEEALQPPLANRTTAPTLLFERFADEDVDAAVGATTKILGICAFTLPAVFIARCRMVDTDITLVLLFAAEPEYNSGKIMSTCF